MLESSWNWKHFGSVRLRTGTLYLHRFETGIYDRRDREFEANMANMVMLCKDLCSNDRKNNLGVRNLRKLQHMEHRSLQQYALVQTQGQCANRFSQLMLPFD